MEKAKILVVEDEAIIAMEIENQLQGLGYEVTSIVDTGEKAIKKAEADKPDIILMDIRIKGEMDGIDAAEEIRIRFGIPVIFSTAYLDQERIERAKITMPFGYVLKPIQERDLKVTIEMALYVAKVDAERKKVEKSLQESEEKYRSLYQNAPAALFRTRFSDGALLECNANLAHMLGYNSREECILEYKGEIHNVDLEKRDIMKLELMEYGEVKNYESHIIKKDGTDIYFQYSGKAYIDQGFIEGGAIDITERKQAEMELLKFKAISDNANYGTAIADMEGNISYVNNYFASIHGYSVNDMIGKPFSICHNEKQLEHVMKVNQELLETNSFSFQEIWHQRKDGSVFPTLMSGILIYETDGKPAHMVATAVDITERKQVESERNLLFEYSSDMLCIIGFDRKFKQVNPVWKKTLGWEEEELLDKLYLDFVHPDDIIPAKSTGTKHKETGNEVLEYENRFRDSRGNYHRVLWNAVPVKNQQITIAIVKVIEE